MKRKLLFSLTTLAVILTIFFSGCSNSEKSDEINSNIEQNDEYSPVSSISMSETEAASLNSSIKVKVYYKTARGDKICSETKLLQFTNKDRKADVLASKIMDLMVTGPTNTGLVKTLPAGSKLNSLKIKKGIAYLDFNEAFAKGVADSNEAVFVAYSITNTLTEFKNVNRVVITCNGNKIESSACDFSNLLRNTSIVTDIESALPQTDYSENVFLEIELE